MHNTEQELKILEHRIDQLIQLCHRLRQENTALRSERDGLRAERLRLRDKADVAARRVESILSRLKTLEQTP